MICRVPATEQSGGLDAILGGGGQGGFDFGSLLGAAQQMQAQMQQAQAEIEGTTFEGVSGGGMVKVTVTGGMSFTGISIDPAVVDPSDVSMLEDLVIAAISESSSQRATILSRVGPSSGHVGFAQRPFRRLMWPHTRRLFKN